MRETLGITNLELISITSKSGIAIEFAHTFRQLYPETHIFWVRGASPQRFEQSYRAIAKGLHLEGHDNPQFNILEMVKHWLTANPKQWLIILDNADEEGLYFPTQRSTADDVDGSAQIIESEISTLSQFLPQNSNGCILVTSRDKRTALQLVGNLPKNLIEVKKLDSEDSLAVIRSRLSVEKVENADLRAFATMLGDIPLAITQACVYIEANEMMSVNGYCEKFHESSDMQQRLLDKASYDLRRDPDIPNAVITTWRISFEHIRSRNPFAAEVLSLLGVLDRQHIPRYILNSLKPDQLEVDEALSQLIAHCLVKSEINREFLEIHPLVEAALHAWMSGCEKLAHWLRVATIIFDQVFPKDLHGNVGNWSRCNLLVPHALKVIQTSTQLPELHTPALAALYTYVAVSLDTQFRLEEAAILHQKAVELVTKERGPHDKVTLAYKCNLADTLHNQKRLSEAEAIYRDIWHYLQENVIHTKTWEMLWFHVPNSLARLLTDMGKTVEARKMQQGLLEVTLVNKGEEDENTLRIMNNFALALFKEGRYDEAESMGRKALETQLRVLKPDSQLILYTMKNLSDYSRAREDFSQAKEYIEAVVIMEERLLPVGHPDRLATSKTLASLFYFQDNYSEAERILRQAQADGDLFPQKSYVLLNLRAELATALDAQGKYSEAETIARDVLNSKQISSDSSDADTWTVMGILASILHHLHKDNEAEDLHWQLLEHYADNGAPNQDGLTREASAAFGSIIVVLGLDMNAESLSYFDKILERQDPQRIGGTQAFQKRVKLLSLVLAKSGRYTVGLELEVTWRDQSDSSSLWKVNNLAEHYLKSDRRVPAKTLLEGLYGEAQEHFGPADNLTLSTAGLLAVAVGSDTDEGAGLLFSVVEHAPPGNQHGLVARQNLAVGYERRGMCLQAFNALKMATDLAQEHFKEDDPVAIGIRTTFVTFLNDHLSSVSPSHLTIRLRDAGPSTTSPDDAGNDASN